MKQKIQGQGEPYKSPAYFMGAKNKKETLLRWEKLWISFSRLWWDIPYYSSINKNSTRWLVNNGQVKFDSDTWF